jgi:hypothetical protein
MSKANPSVRVKQVLLPREKARNASQTPFAAHADKNQRVVAPPREPRSLSGYNLGVKGKEHAGMDPHNQRSVAPPRRTASARTNTTPRLKSKRSAVG